MSQSRSLVCLSLFALVACEQSERDLEPAVIEGELLIEDAATLASTVMDAGAACELDQTYKLSSGGGLAPRDVTIISPLRGYQRVRSRADGSEQLNCSAMLASCGDDAIDAADMMSALNHPDVLAAFEAGGIFGADKRAIDGSVAFFERSDGKKFGLGFCQQPCSEVPPGVLALRSITTRLDQQQAKTTACAQFAQP